MKRVELDQRTDEWKKWREEGVTATESRVIMRRDEWKTPFALWLEKTHRADPPDLSGNPAVRRGVKYEDRARTIFETSLGEPVLPESCAESDENPIFRASFDGLTLDNIPVEIKCPMEGTWNDVRTNGINSRAYKSYWVQVQHQMYVAAAPYAWLVFWNDDELQTFRVDRDQAFIDEMVKAGLAFHECVVKDVPPEIDEELDTFIPKGDEAVGAWVRVAADFVQIDAQVKKLEEELKRLSGVKKTLTDSLCEQMGSFR